jgi:hypothetical protein
MLLYDALLEHAARAAARGDPRVCNAQDVLRIALLKRSAVYELSNVVPLFHDWERETEKRVPRRPPGPRVWCEWRTHHTDPDGLTWDMTVGCVVAPLGEFAAHYSPVGEKYQRAWNASAERFNVQTFRRLDRIPDNCPADLRAKVRPGFLSCDCFQHFFALEEQATRITMLWNAVDLEQVRADPNRWSCLGLPILPFGNGDPNHPACNPWPVFAAFALLHCKNVVTEEVPPGERIQRECAKHKRPPRATFKVLRLELPRLARPRGGEGDGRGPAKRLHLCSGHFKNLTAARYKQPGWHWWNAHMRGDAELGSVRSVIAPFVKES